MKTCQNLYVRTYVTVLRNILLIHSVQSSTHSRTTWKTGLTITPDYFSYRINFRTDGKIAVFIVRTELFKSVGPERTGFVV